MTNALTWLERAKYDLSTAQDLIKSGKYLYVSFMCHQALEKSIKAYYLFTLNKMPPYIHNLPRLADESLLSKDLTEGQKSFLLKMNPFYISSRYPDEIDDLKQTCTKESSEIQIKSTQELLKCLEQKMKS